MWRVGIFLVLMAFGAAVAPTVRATDGVGAVQAEVQQALGRLAALDPSRAFGFGAIEVVPDAAGYGVTVADVTAKLAADDSGYLDIGFVSFRLSPLDDGLYRVDRFEVADRFAHRTADGRTDGMWEFTNRQLSGLWSRRQGGFLRRDADVDVSLAVTGLDTVIGKVAAAGPQSGANEDWLQLMLVRGLAHREATADGSMIDRYDLRVDPNGRVVVNGRTYYIRPPATALP